MLYREKVAATLEQSCAWMDPIIYSTAALASCIGGMQTHDLGITIYSAESAAQYCKQSKNKSILVIVSRLKVVSRTAK